MGWRVMLPGSELGKTVDPLENQHVNFSCKFGEEDPVHFLAACNAPQAERQFLLSHAPLNLPDPAHDPMTWRPKRSLFSLSLALNRKDPNYSSANSEHSTFQVYSPIKEATKRQDKTMAYIIQSRGNSLVPRPHPRGEGLVTFG